jgi:Co/Zn/Cd efflux system component
VIREAIGVFLAGFLPYAGLMLLIVLWEWLPTDPIFGLIRFMFLLPQATVSSKEAVRLACEFYQSGGHLDERVKPFIRRRGLRYYQVQMTHFKGGNVSLWVDMVEGKVLGSQSSRDGTLEK